MTDLVRNANAPESIETFAWRELRFHVITREPLTPDQLRTLRQTPPKIDRIGRFADVLAMVLGWHVQIRTERPSPEIRFEVGR